MTDADSLFPMDELAVDPAAAAPKRAAKARRAAKETPAEDFGSLLTLPSEAQPVETPAAAAPQPEAATAPATPEAAPTAEPAAPGKASAEEIIDQLPPAKSYYTIGDVCDLTGVKPHVLRYWESQFKLLKPARRYSGHRKFSQKDLDLIQHIKFLILEKKFTLAGAKREIQKQMAGGRRAANLTGALPTLRDIKTDIEECLKILDSGA